MAMKIFLIILLLCAPFVFAENITCLSYPIGITTVSIGGSERTISVAKAEIVSLDNVEANQLALAEAELVAKSYLTKEKIATFNGVYMFGSCTEAGYVYVAVAVDKKSQALSKYIKSLLSESFKNSPTLK
jgi:hypothetical protein